MSEEEILNLKVMVSNLDLSIDSKEKLNNQISKISLLLQQKENIIKEVREFIEDRQEDINNGGNEHEYRVNKHILEILDKGE